MSRTLDLIGPDWVAVVLVREDTVQSLRLSPGAPAALVGYHGGPLADLEALALAGGWTLREDSEKPQAPLCSASGEHPFGRAALAFPPAVRCRACGRVVALVGGRIVDHAEVAS